MVEYGEVGVSPLEVEGFEGYGVYASGYMGVSVCVWGLCKLKSLLLVQSMFLSIWALQFLCGMGSFNII